MTPLQSNNKATVKAGARIGLGLGRYQKCVLAFGQKYKGWHYFDYTNKQTKNAVKTLAKRGLIEINSHKQFKVIIRHPDYSNNPTFIGCYNK